MQYTITLIMGLQKIIYAQDYSFLISQYKYLWLISILPGYLKSFVVVIVGIPLFP